MFSNRFAALCASLTFVSAPQVSAEIVQNADCWHADEVSAARVGTLQTLLMVQALKCQDTVPATLASFNKFMADKHDLIVRDKYLIQAHFVRQYGAGDGMKASDDYQTKLGNQNSSAVVTVAECEKAATYSRLAAGAGEEDLSVLAGMVSAAVPIVECPAPATTAAKPAAMVIQVWKPAQPAPAPAAAGAPVAVQPAVAVAAPGEHSPEVLAAIAGPVPVRATAPAPTPAVFKPAPAPVPAPSPSPAAAPSNADTMKALQAAVAALTQVAATLQPVAAATPTARAQAEE